MNHFFVSQERKKVLLTASTASAESYKICLNKSLFLLHITTIIAAIIFQCNRSNFLFYFSFISLIFLLCPIPLSFDGKSFPFGEDRTRDIANYSVTYCLDLHQVPFFVFRCHNTCFCIAHYTSRGYSGIKMMVKPQIYRMSFAS